MKTAVVRRRRRLSFTTPVTLSFAVVVAAVAACRVGGAFGITTTKLLQSAIGHHHQNDSGDTHQDRHVQFVVSPVASSREHNVGPSLSPAQQKHILEDIRNRQQEDVDNNAGSKEDSSAEQSSYENAVTVDHSRQRSMSYVTTGASNVHHQHGIADLPRYQQHESLINNNNNNNYYPTNRNGGPDTVGLLSPPPPPPPPAFQALPPTPDYSANRRRIASGGNNQKYQQQQQQYQQQQLPSLQALPPPSDLNGHAGHYIQPKQEANDNFFYRPDATHNVGQDVYQSAAPSPSTVANQYPYFGGNQPSPSPPPPTVFPFKPSPALDPEPPREPSNDDSEIEQQIRQQLQSSVPTSSSGSVSSSAINNLLKKHNPNTRFTILNAPDDFNMANLSALPGLPADLLAGSSGQSEFVQVGANGQQLIQLPPGIDVSSIPGLSNAIKSISAGADGKTSNTAAVKTVVIRQKPTPSNSTATTTTTTTTAKPPSVVLEELTRNVLPPGADYQVIRHDPEMGLLEQVQLDAQNKFGSAPGSAPSSNKKVTFVILEERPDGTVRVQGVRDNSGGSSGGVSGSAGVAGDSSASASSSTSSELNTIIDKLNRGELKLPPSSISNSPKKSTASKFPAILKPASTTATKAAATSTTLAPVPTPLLVDRFNDHDTYAQLRPSSVYKGTTSSQSGSTSINHQINTGKKKPSDYFGEYSDDLDFVKPSAGDPDKRQPNSDVFLPTAITAVNSATTAGKPQHYTPTSTSRPSTVSWSKPLGNIKNTVNSFPSLDIFKQTSNSHEPPFALDDSFGGYKQNDEADGFQTETNNNAGQPSFTSQQSSLYPSTLSSVLKNRGFYAMAKFLRQSGLDSILNDTMGPFTIFVPTDKAFRSLLVQLGGPDKADEKFRENPRLLIGLLLHHVIPGAFSLKSLQDEMTGVSLAGTQLRVNTYTTQDVEWNDIKVITINGARVLDDKKDIIINYPPSGSTASSHGAYSMAHAIDRVLFPLPVGDLLQTLQSDRDQRYMEFLKLVRYSGMASVLSGSKTHTLFAPINRAFLGNSNASRLLERIESSSAPQDQEEESVADEAKALVMRHMVPNAALYTAGMKFYQVKESLQKNSATPSVQLTIYKDAGRVRVNSANIIARNIPATNGVIHAIDSLL
ncbi:uncharacterized protein LOC126847955 [Adelges cooleyi]|uniref:uncharacterized protein LOC126847955 n=1 Tax=Adelges cooleyi TaxID=133065 RepID=UPI00217FA265|nr:uncharacterized protein LOC126847955 [Adelges cooleyi]